MNLLPDFVPFTILLGVIYLHYCFVNEKGIFKNKNKGQPPNNGRPDFPAEFPEDFQDYD